MLNFEENFTENHLCRVLSGRYEAKKEGHTNLGSASLVGRMAAFTVASNQADHRRRDTP